MQYIGHFLLVGAIFAVIDAVWIGVVANKFYKSQMNALLLEKPDFVPAVLFYIIYIAGIIVLVLQPALAAQSLAKVIGYGATFGLAAYATYDLTNASTLKGWPKLVTVVDMVWGTAVTTLSATIAYLIIS